MKRLIFFLVALVLSNGLSAQKSSLSGTLSGVPEGCNAVLYRVVGEKFVVEDTLRIDKNNNFKVSFDVSVPTLFFLQIDNGDGNMCYLMVEPKERIHANFVYMAGQRVYRIGKCKGSENVELYAQFNEILAAAGTQTEVSQIPVRVAELIRNNKDKLMAAFLVTFFEQDFDNYVHLYKEVCDALTPKYAEVNYVKHLAERLKGVLVAGMEAPEIAMSDPSGAVRRLSDLRGKVVLIDFWASWCGPCRRENPNVVRLYHKYRDKGFEIFSVSLDRSGDAWRNAIKADGLVWPNHVSDLKQWQSAAGRLYGIMSIPATVLVDRDGRIIARNLRGVELDRKLEEIFEKE